MKKALKQVNSGVYYYNVEGFKVAGVHEYISGDLTDTFGDVTCIRGNITGVYGDVSDLKGNVTGIYGSATGVQGDLDDCDIREEERSNYISLDDLVNRT